MKAKRSTAVALACGCVLAWRGVAHGALPSEWRHAQQFEVSAPGLVKLSLPVDTLDAARPGLEDLRLCDDAGNELPYLIELPAPAGWNVRIPTPFQVILDAKATIITLNTGPTRPVDGVTLETPATDFIKAVHIEGSTEDPNARQPVWREIAQGQPIFRQPYGAAQLRVSFPPGVWRSLRLTLDDQRSPPIPITGAQVHAAAAEAAPDETQAAVITERNDMPGQTRLTLNLGAANLDVASVSVETDEPLFTRAVTFAVPQVEGSAIREQVIGRGVIYRVALQGQPVSTNLTMPLGVKVRSRELVMLIHNEDSPPLAIRGVSIERRPVHFVFMARQAGTYHLLTGNKSCMAPRYDLAGLDARLRTAAVMPVRISPLGDNPDYRAPEALSGLEVTGAALDARPWKFRKAIRLERGGAEQLDLDIDVLAHADGSLADLRLLRGSNQVPYIVERTSITKPLALSVTATNDAKEPKLSRWIIKLPQAGLPLARVTCASQTPLFQRQMTLYEEEADERGEKLRRPLGEASWTQTPERKAKEFSLELSGTPQTDKLILETGNGDNPPIKLEQFTSFYPVSRVLFKATADDRLFVYYGNPLAPAPSYDLNLVAGELLATDKSAATLGAEEQLRKDSWADMRSSSSGGVVFWGILGTVVAGLLVIVSRLLPKTPPPTAT